MSTQTSPNMGIVVPVVSSELGPAWATEIFNAFFTTLDQHNHTAGKGVQVPTAGININADLGFGGFNATNFRSVRLANQGSPLALGPDIGCLYESGGELWYNDSSARQVKLTNTGNANVVFLSYPERTPAISGTFTILATDAFSLYYVDTSGGAATINLPASSGVTVGRTYIFVDIKRNASTNNITVVPNGADKINTVAGSFVITINGVYTIFTTDAAGNWYANTWSAFDQLNITTNLNWVAGDTTPTITQASTSVATSATMLMRSQASTANPGNVGGFQFDMPLPVGAGTHGQFLFTEGNSLSNTVGCKLWNNATYGNSFESPAGLSIVGLYQVQGVGAQPVIFNVGTGAAGLHFRDFSFNEFANFSVNGIQLCAATQSFGNGTFVIGIGNRTAAPTANPTGGGILYAESGGGIWRGSGGAVSTFAVTGEGTQNTQAGLWPRRQVFGRTTTTGGTFTVDTPIPTTTTALLRWTVSGRLVSGTGTVGDAGIITQETGYKNVGGVVTRLAGTDNLITSRLDTNFNASAASAPNSTNARITVTAPSSEGATPTIDWTVTVDYIVN